MEILHAKWEFNRSISRYFKTMCAYVLIKYQLFGLLMVLVELISLEIIPECLSGCEEITFVICVLGVLSPVIIQCHKKGFISSPSPSLPLRRLWIPLCPLSSLVSCLADGQPSGLLLNERPFFIFILLFPITQKEGEHQHALVLTSTYNSEREVHLEIYNEGFKAYILI